jgi:phosphohistidine phosphatase
MALKLILMRHAKSDWGTPGQDDFDRPLNGRGRNSANAMAGWLLENGHVPDTVLVSGAKRTVETWDRMSRIMAGLTLMESVPALYLSAAETILNVIRTRSAGALLVICHNPGISEFARRIVTTPPDDDRFQSYPTAATTVIEFDADRWDQVTWASGNVLQFAVPRDLLDQTPG